MQSKSKYQTVNQLTVDLFGYELPRTTLHRWVNGINKKGIALKVVRLGGAYMTTEEDLREFLELTATPDIRQPLEVRTTTSARARAKRMARAAAQLDAQGII